MLKNSLELHPIAQKALANLGISELNSMQQAAFLSIQQRRNTILLSPTGSGKTLAFLLPVLQLMREGKSGVQCVIISPTRELAIQIERVWQKMATGFKVSTCYGGHPMQIETNNLVEPPALLIGTPGRILEHINRQTFVTASVETLILDEFDKSLSLGFQEQMGEIIQHLKGLEKRVLVSATNKMTIPEFTGVTEPHVLNFSKMEMPTNSGFSLKYVKSATEDKLETLFQLLCTIGAEQTLVFCNLRETTETTQAFLKKKGLDAASFHGGMEQLDREKALINFRNGSTTFFVTSDLAARGLDIPEVKNVVHYEIPLKNNDFVHRNGRTARMHAGGTAYLVLSSTEEFPVYLSEKPERAPLPLDFVLPQPSPWITLYISGGKKDKLSKMDIVGFLSKKGELTKDDLGKIEILDFMSFVAVKKSVANELLRRVKDEKMKGQKYKMNIAW
jgi:ATP-dependent RNA helicase DbpA